MLPLRLAQAQVQTTYKGYKTGRMVYNELQQEGILSVIRFGLALLAYTDILLCSIWSFYKIRQTPVYKTLGGTDNAENRVLIHPNCHKQVHAKGLTVSKPRPVKAGSQAQPGALFHA